MTRHFSIRYHNIYIHGRNITSIIFRIICIYMCIHYVIKEIIWQTRSPLTGHENRYSVKLKTKNNFGFNIPTFNLF